MMRPLLSVADFGKSVKANLGKFVVGVVILTAPTLLGAAISGIYVWTDAGEEATCFDSETMADWYPHNNLDSAFVSIMRCADETDTLESGYTDAYGWYDLQLEDTTIYRLTEELGYSVGGWYVIAVTKDAYTEKKCRAYFYDSSTVTVIPVELKVAPECSTYTWQIRLIDRRTQRPLVGAVATITQLQTPWFCGDTLQPWGAGSGGTWTEVSDTDGAIETEVLRGAVIKVSIPVLSYEEIIIMDEDKTSGRLLVSPTGGYRR